MNAPRLVTEDRTTLPPHLNLTPDDLIYLALWLTLQQGGFTEVMRLCSRAQKRLAAAHPDECREGGWIV